MVSADVCALIQSFCRMRRLLRTSVSVNSEFMMSEEINASDCKCKGKTPVAEYYDAPQTVESVLSAEEIGKAHQIAERGAGTPQNGEIYQHQVFGVLKTAKDSESHAKNRVLYLERQNGPKEWGGQRMEIRIIGKEVNDPVAEYEYAQSNRNDHCVGNDGGGLYGEYCLALTAYGQVVAYSYGFGSGYGYRQHEHHYADNACYLVCRGIGTAEMGSGVPEKVIGKVFNEKRNGDWKADLEDVLDDCKVCDFLSSQNVEFLQLSAVSAEQQDNDKGCPANDGCGHTASDGTHCRYSQLAVHEYVVKRNVQNNRNNAYNHGRYGNHHAFGSVFHEVIKTHSGKSQDYQVYI